MRLSLIVAVANNRVIGRDGRLPWRLSADLRRFKRLTMGHHVILGRKTFESIGRPLPGRHVIVLTRQADYADPRGENEVRAARSLQQAMQQAADDSEVFVAGGASVYAEALPLVSRMYYTAVDAAPAGDILFPEIDFSQWRVIEETPQPADEKNEYPSCFLVYEVSSTIPPPALPMPPRCVTPHAPVEFCYTLVHAAEAVGVTDLADGEFLPGDRTLEEGIERQLNYLLDQVGCDRPGFRLLEIGSGYGRLLKLAGDRGARAVGVNISPEQVKYCRDRGLNAYCCSYRDLLHADAWHGQFDGVIANGSLEHWVQPQDVQAGRMNAIYHESFEITHKALDPAAVDARYVTTAIHVKREVKPEYLLTPWRRQPRGADRRHFSLLHHWMGGWYPVDGQLEACAKPYFTLETETDGTVGYRIANDYRMPRLVRGLYANPRMMWRLGRCLVRRPRVTRTMFQSFFIEKSWDWQFRGDDPPMKLLRHTWRRSA